MRISEALSPTHDIVVHFSGAVLNVTYRPSSYSLKQIEEMSASAEKDGKAERILPMIQNMVVAWDLTDTVKDHDGNEVLGDDGQPLEMPVDPKDTAKMREIPLNVFTDVMKAIRVDQSSGEAERPSVDS